MLQKITVCSVFAFTCFVKGQNISNHKKETSAILSSIILSEDELADETGEVSNVSGVFSASNDVYLNTVAFEFQGVFYRARGLGSENVTFLLNGVHQNRLYDDRPAWNNWGGVDGIYRNQDVTPPLGVASKAFGGLLGVYALTTRASKYRSGTRVSYARSNRSYQNKIAVTHSGSFFKKYHYVFSTSKRWGDQGYKEGTFYNANSIMLSVEKNVNKHHSFTASLLYTPNIRGASGVYTNEVYTLKGNMYNGNWGLYNGKKRNARVREVKEPLFLLTHNYNKNDNTVWQNSLLYQTGYIGYSRLDYNKGINPDPAYYQKLPSYWLSRNNVDYENVYRYQNNFINNGQVNWHNIYNANAEMVAGGNTNAYVLYSDKRAETRLQLNSNLTKKLSKYWFLNTSFNTGFTTSKNYAEVLDLLGGNGYLDLATFTLTQNDLNYPDRVVTVGDKFKYNYKVFSVQSHYFIQTSWRGKHVEFSKSLKLSYIHHQRTGFYNNESYSDSAGKSNPVDLFSLKSKVNLLYKLSGRNLFDVKIAYLQKSPNVKTVFPNARYSNRIMANFVLENTTATALSYIRRGINHNIKLTAYYNLQNNVTETAYYFAEGFGTSSVDDVNRDDLLSNNSLFVQELLSGISKKYKGLEFGASYDLSASVKLKGVIGLGNYTYNNNPNLLLFTEDHKDAQELGFVNGEKNFGKSFLKSKKLSVGPQQAFSFVVEYNDPDYWRIKVGFNHFRNNYVDVAPLLYTSNFTNELNGTSIKDIDQYLVTKFREQEMLQNFTLINLSGSKSWKVQNKYISLFWSVQNLLNVSYRTGGFTSSRAANYSEQLKEYNREVPLFGTRYFVGNGRTFFTGLYYSF